MRIIPVVIADPDGVVSARRFELNYIFLTNAHDFRASLA